MFVLVIISFPLPASNVIPQKSRLRPNVLTTLPILKILSTFSIFLLLFFLPPRPPSLTSHPGPLHSSTYYIYAPPFCIHPSLLNHLIRDSVLSSNTSLSIFYPSSSTFPLSFSLPPSLPLPLLFQHVKFQYIFISLYFLLLLPFLFPLLFPPAKSPFTPSC